MKFHSDLINGFPGAHLCWCQQQQPTTKLTTAEIYGCKRKATIKIGREPNCAPSNQSEEPNPQLLRSASLIYPPFNACGLMCVYIKVGNIYIFGLKSV